MGLAVSASTRVWAEIDLGAICSNVEFIRGRIGPRPGIVAVVKANAYGHGVREVVRAIRDRVEIFGVANVAEALEVREADGERDILLLGPCLPAERKAAAMEGFIATVSSAEEARAFSGASKEKARLNLKVDTGMGRIGAWHETALNELSVIAGMHGVDLHSVSTHLPLADEDADLTRDQLALFDQFIRRAKPLAPGARFHVLNSAGICRFPEYAYEMVRPGLALYGSIAIPEYQHFLRVPLAWKTRVLLVREVGPGRGISYGRTFVTRKNTMVATLAAGYADGYPRQLSGKGASVLIGGARCPLLGRVTMDQIMVDISAAGAVAPGDEAVLIGTQMDQEIRACEIAEKAGTIAWDIFTGIGGRTARFHH